MKPSLNSPIGLSTRIRETPYTKQLGQILCLHDFEAEAKRRLPRLIYGYIAGAAEENSSLADNRAAFDDYGLVTKVLRDVSRRSQSVKLFGETYCAPFGIAPMGIAALSNYRGDLVLARAARDAGIVSILSGTSLIPLESVAQEAPSTWFQAYVPGDQHRIDALLDRVETAGYQTLVITVDIPVSANRENNVRAGFSTPLRPNLRLAWEGVTHPTWLVGTLLKTIARHGMPHFENSFATRGAPMLSRNALRDFSARDHLNWEHLKRIRHKWCGNLVVKGILSVADAVRAKQLGVDAVVLSNHGGRQLDGAISAMRVLEETTNAVGTMPVLIDGGFRRGSDVLKALALGARMVLIGRPFNYALAAAGELGVRHAISLLYSEIDRNMAMLGMSSCSEINRQVLLRKCCAATDADCGRGDSQDDLP